MIINQLILSYNIFYNLLLFFSYKLPIFVSLSITKLFAVENLERIEREIQELYDNINNQFRQRTKFINREDATEEQKDKYCKLSQEIERMDRELIEFLFGKVSWSTASNKTKYIYKCLYGEFEQDTNYMM